MLRRPSLPLLTALLVGLATATASPAAHAADRDCADFPSQRAAQIFYLNHGGPQVDPHRLDSDGDGIACESNPAPYYYGTTLPGGGGGGGQPDPEPQITVVRSAVDLTMHPTSRIAGESFRVKVAVRPAVNRSVLIQRKVGGRWKTAGKGATGRDGAWTRKLTAPRSRTAYRAVVQSVTRGTTRYTAASSRTRTLRVQRQRVSLSFADRVVDEGEQTRASIRATPVRAGRSVALQMRSGGSWRTVREDAVDRRGRVTFTITPQLGPHSFRAVALRHRGAAVVRSATRTLTAADVTPPPVPYDLLAVPGDGSVELSWSRATPADFDHHEVWMRTDDSSWALVTVTSATSAEILLLQNDVTYWFAVTSVDEHDNVSARSTPVSATPVAAEEPVGRPRR